MDQELQNRNDIISVVLKAAESKLPLRLTDIAEFAGKLNKNFLLAKQALKLKYGIVVSAVPNTKSGKKYICYSEQTAHSRYEYDEEQQRHVTLLFLLLSYIFMSGGQVDELELEDFLKGLEIDWDETHSYFGSYIKKLIHDTFTKQLYLKREKYHCPLVKEIKYMYSWGYRSEVEFKKKDVLEATAKILDKPASVFTEQYLKACEEEEENEEEEEKEEAVDD